MHLRLFGKLFIPVRYPQVAYVDSCDLCGWLPVAVPLSKSPRLMKWDKFELDGSIRLMIADQWLKIPLQALQKVRYIWKFVD